jgi:threonine dehydratase
MNDSMSLNPISTVEIAKAAHRIMPYLHQTPIMTSEFLDNCLGHELLFKVDSLQKTGSFKVRGVVNTLLALQEHRELPEHIVAYSSGNHGLAIAWAAKKFGIKATIFLASYTSPVKIQACLGYGAEVVLTDTRAEAEELSRGIGANGAYFLHPSDNDLVIAGNGTACFEALQVVAEPSAIFAPCGGGGLLSGTLLASRLVSPRTKVFAGEPLQANDAAQSCRALNIMRFDESPPTIAEGARTLAITPRTFQYLQQLDGFVEVEEEEIIYWTIWLTHLLKVTIEPTAAIAMAAAYKWLGLQGVKQRVLVIISGGNIDTSTYSQVWYKNYLDKVPGYY